MGLDKGRERESIIPLNMIRGERETIGIPSRDDLLGVLKRCGLAQPDRLSGLLEAGFTEVAVSMGQGKWSGISFWSRLMDGFPWSENTQRAMSGGGSEITSSYPFVINESEIRDRRIRVAISST